MSYRLFLRATTLTALTVLAVACNVSRSHVTTMTPESDSAVNDPPERVEVSFDRSMDATTITTDTFLVDGAETGSYAGVVIYDPLTRKAMFTPGREFARGETITVRLTDDVKSTSDKRLRAFRGEFRVRPPVVIVPDPLEITSIDPANETVGVSDLPTLRIGLSTSYNPFSVTADTVVISGSRSGAITPVFPNLFLGFDQLTIQLDRGLIAGERVTVLLGNGLASTEGGRLAETRLSFTVASDSATLLPSSLSSAAIDATEGRLLFLDVDADGRDEWVAVHPDGRIEAQEFEAGSVGSIEVQQLSEGVIDVAVGDFDGDGRCDLVCLGASNTKLFLLTGSTDSSTLLDTASEGTIDTATIALAAATIDLDRPVDLLLVPLATTDAAQIAWGASPTAFVETSTVSATIAAPAVLADFDRDGIIDIAHRDATGAFAWAWGRIPTDGRDRDLDWVDAEIDATLTDFTELQLASLDGDEHVDVALLGTGASAGIAVSPAADRTWIALTLPVGSTVAGASLGDVDGDGTLDSLTPSVGNAELRVWSDLATETTPITLVEAVVRSSLGDIDGDGVLDLGLINAAGTWEIAHSVPTHPPAVDRVWATDITAAPGAASQPFDIRADHDDDLDGFTVALAFDPLLISVDRLSTLGSDSEAVGIELELPNIDPVGGTAVIAVVFDFLPPFDGQQLTAGVDHVLLTGDLTVDSAATPQTTPLIVGAGIGSPPNDTSFVVAGLTVDPTLEDGLVTVQSGGSTPPPTSDFVRGDVNGDATIDLADANFLQAYLFQGGAEPSCLDAADVNDDGAVDNADPAFLFDYLLTGGSPPPAPFPAVGSDPTGDALTCGAGS